MSYAIGRAGTWIAWRLMRETRAAIADNLRPLFPGETTGALETRARKHTRGLCLRRDRLHSIPARSDADLDTLFDHSSADSQMILDLLRNERGLILVSGHYGNWEVGAVFIRRIVKIPFAIIAMAEDNPTVNRLRREIRAAVGADTIEVGQSLETALQIRRRLCRERPRRRAHGPPCRPRSC